MSASVPSIGRPDGDAYPTGMPADPREARASLSLLLATGGDLRIWPNPTTGRNRYGTRTTPAPHEISFASTTASTVTASGFAAAEHALDQLFAADCEPKLPIDQWFEQIRASIVDHLGIPGAQAVLAASGTDAEILALALIIGLPHRPLTNIVVAPEETGTGVPLAAAGRHFSDMTALGASVRAGSAIEGIDADQIEIRTVAIRDGNGAPLEPAAIDRDAEDAVEQALRRGRDVLLHVLETSKTGLMGVTRETARRLAASAPEHVRVVIDACQLRCSQAQLSRDLEDGFMVIATGSKFAGGPPFSGVLLLPARLADEFATGASLPAGLHDYSAALDWPAALRRPLGSSLTAFANLGLGLRWTAALASIALLAGVGDEVQSRILKYFAEAVRSRALELDGVALHCDEAQRRLGLNSIISLTVLALDGSFATPSEAQRIQTLLRVSPHGPVCHVGQCVRLDSLTVLRVAASAQDVAGIAARMAAGSGIDVAFRPVASDLDAMFAKWSDIRRGGATH